MNRPYVICHMLISIDGKVTGDFLYKEACKIPCDEYYRINRELCGDAYACGRVTMDGSFAHGFKPDLSMFKGEKQRRDHYVADKEARFFAVSFDRRGKLGWQSNKIIDEDPGYGNAHIIEVMCENADDEYISYLKSIGVSYVFAGKDEMDISSALALLKEKFGISKLLLEGGSIINGAFLQADVIDELSLVLVPIVADKNDKSLFYNADYKEFEFISAQRLEGGALWLRFKKKNIQL